MFIIFRYSLTTKKPSVVRVWGLVSTEGFGFQVALRGRYC